MSSIVVELLPVIVDLPPVIVELGAVVVEPLSPKTSSGFVNKSLMIRSGFAID